MVYRQQQGHHVRESERSPRRTVRKNFRMMLALLMWEATNLDWGSETYKMDILLTPRSLLPFNHVFL